MRITRKTFVLLGIGAAAILGFGCKPHSQQQQQMPAPAVTVATIDQREVVEWDEFTGRTAAIENVEVRPRISGHIDAVKFQSGQVVKKGDVLFQIDPRWHKATLDQRNAEFESAKVKLANAEREAKRTPQLLATKAISTEESDQRQMRFDEA